VNDASEPRPAPPAAPPKPAEQDGCNGTQAAKPAAELTPEEQMAAYEESLKESDWGHQPC